MSIQVDADSVSARQEVVQVLDDTGGRESLSRSLEDEGSVVDPADALLQRGSYLRSLRRLEQQDEAERNNNNNSSDGGNISATEGEPSPSIDDDDDTTTLSNGTRLLHYDRYLRHQRYYDDLKHIDCHFIEYSVVALNSNNNNDTVDFVPSQEETTPPPLLVVEQDKSLGKGGLCWDAAFILAEYLVATQSAEWFAVPPSSAACNDSSANNTAATNATPAPVRILELGAGTGLCGLLLAKHLESSSSSAICRCEIAVTDLPELVPLLQRNVHRNFCSNDAAAATTTTAHDENGSCSQDEDDVLNEYLANQPNHSSAGNNHSLTSFKVTASILPWGDLTAEAEHGLFDVVLGADVVASLYDPVALARCIHRLLRSDENADDDDDDDNNNCHRATTTPRVYISFKERLSTLHRQFEAEMARLFQSVEIVDPRGTTRNRNPDVKILIATGKRRQVTAALAAAAAAAAAGRG